MGFDSPIHWLIVIAVIALLFGGSRVGNVMGELGKGIKAFKQNISDADPAKPEATKQASPQPAPEAQNRVAEEAKVEEAKAELARAAVPAEHTDQPRH